VQADTFPSNRNPSTDALERHDYRPRSSEIALRIFRIGGAEALGKSFKCRPASLLASQPRKQRSTMHPWRLLRRWSLVSILERYDFSAFRNVVDVEGREGLLLAEILSAHPRLRGILCDLPHVVGGARETIESRKVFDRCGFESGRFFDSVLSFGGIAISSNTSSTTGTTHERKPSWLTVAKRCRQALRF
jgi:hypothetical protein